MKLEIALLHQGDPESQNAAARRSAHITDRISKSLLEEYKVHNLFVDDERKWVDKASSLRSSKVLVFNAADLGLYHNNAFESHIVAILETLDLPYTGSSSRTLTTSIDKYTTKLVLQDAGIPTPKVYLLSNVPKEIEFPVILKPRRAYGSRDIAPSSIIKSGKQLEQKINEITNSDSPLKEHILEEYIEYADLPEVTVGFIGNDTTRKVLTPLGFTFGAGYANRPKIRDFESKFTEGSATYGQCVPGPLTLSQPLQQLLAQNTNLIAENLEIADYGRFDFRIKKEGTLLVPYIIDTNANPDLNDDASLFLMTNHEGSNYQQFIRQIVNAARQRYDLKN